MSREPTHGDLVIGWWLASLAFARPEASAALVVVDPSGKTVFDGEIPVGGEQHFEHAVGSRVWQLDLGTEMVSAGMKVEAALIERTGSSEKARATAALEPPEGQEVSAELTSKRLEGGWSVRVQWARTWNPGGQGPLPGGKSRYALVWDDAAHVDHPRDTAPPQIRAPLPDGRSAPARQSSPHKVVHTWGEDYLEVESVPSPEDEHCTQGAPSGRDTPHQSYVPVTDLVQWVTTSEVSASFADGTGYAVAAGTPVVRLAGDAWEVHAGDLVFPILLTDAGQVGSRYLPTAQFVVNASGPTLAPGESGALGEIPPGTVRWIGAAPPVLQGRSGVREPVVVVRQRCAEVRLKADAAQVQPPRAAAAMAEPRAASAATEAPPAP